METAYTERGPILVPDNKFDKLPPDCKEVPLRGYGYISAVVMTSDETDCLGWKVKSNPIP